jgi:hypothetical protein
MMRDERGLCEICGQVWCGRPCLNDPNKSNALLFHKDGRAKTLRERGLGWDGKLKAAASATETPRSDATETSPATETSSKGGRPKKEGALSSTERSRRRREVLRILRGGKEGE